MKVEIYGLADDEIGVRVDGEIRHQITTAGTLVEEPPPALLLTLEVRSTDVERTEAERGVRVHGIYDGRWSFAAGYLGEDMPIPDGWSLRMERQHPSSMRMVVDTGAEPVEVTFERGDPLPSRDDLGELF